MIKPLKDKCSCLEELKQVYEKFKKRHNLPRFTELNRFFDIEEVDTDTEFLLRKIRRIISDRIAGYLRFIETILNPSIAPMFFFKLIKKLDENDKRTLTEVYETLGNFEVELVGLDLSYNEEKEAEFIKKSYEIFNSLKEKLLRIVEKLNNSEDKKFEDKGSYFG